MYGGHTMARQFVVVTRAASGARFTEGEGLEVAARTAVGPVLVRLRTRYSDEGFESPIPRELWVEIRGEAECSLDEAINVYWSTANGILPSLAVAVNAPISDLDVHIAFDATLAENEHTFFENFLPDERGRPRHGRAAAIEETLQFMRALTESDEQPRIARACAFYREALDYLQAGQEVLHVVFLWMAVEALTKVGLRRACAAEGCSEDELLVRWGLAPPKADSVTVKAAKRGLDGEVRRRLIFHGDAVCLKRTVDASDGFEHGFEAFDRIRRLALDAKERGATEHVRRALFELLGVPDRVMTTLVGGRFEKPRANWPITKYMRGTFIGPMDKLAAAGQEYPLLRWEGRVRKFRRNADGTTTLSFDENVTVLCGEGVQFRPESFEVWGPENDPL
jgi:hypothetical protein